MEEKVDILVTTYNTKEKYLRKQIESILKQTHKNMQVYISDDNSTEPEVEKILKEYEKKDERIKLFIQQTNLGYNKNFEFLLKQSTSKYIMFSDHDDVWHKDKVEKSLKQIVRDNVDMVYSNCRQVDEDGVVLQEDYFKYKNVPIIKGTNRLAVTRCVGIGCSQIITKEVKEKMIPFKDSVIAHDWLAAFIANEGKGISYIKEPLFDYRLHASNVFGGRSLNNNITRWKNQNGEGYESYLKYRTDAIERAYLKGIIMCKEYCQKEQNNKIIGQAQKYYESILKSKKINLNIIGYFKILAGKNQFKKSIREIILFHFPIIGYIKFAKIKNEYIMIDAQ
ncbi:MAG: glycosyltransferase [Clostridia bacterium]|nr:glycosyltransferase [Clostridia bacterium]